MRSGKYKENYNMSLISNEGHSMLGVLLDSTKLGKFSSSGVYKYNENESGFYSLPINFCREYGIEIDKSISFFTENMHLPFSIVAILIKIDKEL